MTEELDALRNKNSELLDELKKARAKNKELETLQEQLTAANAEVLELKLHKPVRELLEQVLIEKGGAFAIRDIMEDYTFQLAEDGSIQMLDGDKPVDFTVSGVTEFLSGVEKYAPVTRALARNETVQSAQQASADNQPLNFGIH